MQTNDPEKLRALAREWGPGATDAQLRQALMTCWLQLPSDKRTAAALENEFRRLVDRLFADFREDSAAFGIGGDIPK